LIGVGDVTTPDWARVDRSVVQAGSGRMLRAVPRTLAATARRA
jgi:hypothetical protein